jgi:hypothetical protein
MRLRVLISQAWRIGRSIHAVAENPWMRSGTWVEERAAKKLGQNPAKVRANAAAKNSHHSANILGDRAILAVVTGSPRPSAGEQAAVRLSSSAAERLTMPCI